jgi:hypothetical protein
MKELEIQKKKDIDTKATKGRKIKYLVHDKLLNFMAPSENLYLLPGKISIINNLFGIQSNASALEKPSNKKQKIKSQS